MIKLLIAAPATLFMLAVSAIALAFGTAPTPGVTLVGPGPKGTVAATPEWVAAARPWALLFHAEGQRGPALVMWVAIYGAESGYRSDALGDNYPIRGLLCPSHGGGQIRSCPGTPKGLDRGPREWLIVPVNNVRKALQIFTGARGWTPWSTYTNGRYLDWTEVALAATEGLR